MRVKHLNINNVRNISETKIEPDPGMNCFIGENGAGKTSILEALVVLSKGRSFKTGQISSLIGQQNDSFQVFGSFQGEKGDIHQLGVERGRDYWKARHNKEDVIQLSELTQFLPHVLLEPSSHTLISGPPEGRRKYLDWGVFHVEHSFLEQWRRYNRVLKQRNAALRQSSKAVVLSLDHQFVELGEKLHRSRAEYVQRISDLFIESLPAISETLKQIKVSYRKGWAGDSLEEALKTSGERDMERGSTGPGPHKADLYLSMDGVPAKEHLSRGEQKALTAAMIITQAQIICKSGEKPMLLLDDIASEFDREHLDNVLKAGMALGAQIWLTGTEVLPTTLSVGHSCHVFHVEHGKVSKVSEND